MCELLGMSANVPTDIVFSFTGLMQRGGGTGPHRDGWGIAFYEGRGVRLFQDPLASVDSEVARLVQRFPIKSETVIGHIRQANVGKVGLSNTHPFIRELGGRYWTFAHNGQLADFQPKPGFYRPVGETDSEAAFCDLLNRVRRAFPEPVPVEVLSPEHLFTDHHGERHHDNWDMVGGGCSTTEDCTTFAWNYGGNTYVSSHVTAMNAFTGDYFLCFPEQEYVEEAFTDLFGYDGVCITYEDQLETGTCTVNDYYIFQESEAGTEVYLLARMYGEAQRIDLDGNGTEELVSTDGWDRAQLVFQWGGQLYETDALAALREFWPELAAPVTPCAWSPEARCLQVQGIVSGGDGGFSARALYFDGKNLLLCKPVREMTDHTLSGVQVPAAVLETALETVRTEFARWQERDNASADRPAWDDYCIMDLFPVYPAETDRIPEGLDLVVYQVQYEFHTSAPERVMLAGGIYVDEDGWVGGFSSDSPAFLLFQRPEDGSYVYLGSAGYDFDPGAPAFVRWVNGVLGEHGLPQMPVPEV